MATWGLHIRMAEALLNKGYNLHEESFLVGNIGPDCGVPNEDWSKFDPPTEISHWSDEGRRNIYADKFFDAYLTKDLHDEKEKSFLVGYFVHLLTDIEWRKFVIKKKEEDKNYAELHTNRNFIWTIKEDWYDLDHVYFRDNPDNLFLSTFQHITDFPDYLDYYPKGAVARQVKFITEYYQKPSENLDREYQYLTMGEMDSFLAKTVDIIHDELQLKLA